jgi:nucleolar protein TMA23
MDAHAHLLSLGWAGPGHSLDSRPHKGRRGLAYDPKQAQNTGNGLIKPLLISQKKNTFGVGKKAHEPTAGNEWWLKGFETALSNVGKSESERTSGTATPELGRSANGYPGKHVGLYGFFVKGGEMEGTIGRQVGEEDSSTRRKKRKSDALENQESSRDSSDGKDRSRVTRKKRKSKEGKGTEEFEQVTAFLQARDKGEKRRQRKQKADALGEFQQVGEFFEVRSARKKASPDGSPDSDVLKPVEDVMAQLAENAGEARRRRRRAKKAEKAAKDLQAASQMENAPAPTLATVQDDLRGEKNAGDASIFKAARKAEKKRRKESERK